MTTTRHMAGSYAAETWRHRMDYLEITTRHGLETYAVSVRRHDRKA